MTTGTVTSARVLGQRLPPRAFHQYVPLDRPRWVRRFLDHWRPDLVIWTESEIWPNFLDAIARRGLPAALVNGRMSPRSARRWQRTGKAFRQLMDAFAVRLAQSEPDAARFSALGAPFLYAGNLKFAIDPPPVDEALLARLRRAVGRRPCWLAASTHPGEDEIAIAVHLDLMERFPDVLTVLVPRHPYRADGIAKMAEQAGLCVDRRSQGALPDAQTQIYLADTLGELGLFYHLAPVTFVGGSFDQGGHNPVEAAQAGSAVTYGPDMHNNAAIAHALESGGGSVPIADENGLSDVVGGWLDDPEAARASVARAQAVLAREAETVTVVMEALAPLCGRLGPVAGT